ncbi:Ribosomal protein S24/S35 mitochondrial [Euphorbia peplus]|nr:Ribosomal protein S24/S35 mitochondrial [Euphorbia peplus]
MRRAILRNLSLTSRNLTLNPSKPTSIPKPSLNFLASSNHSRLRFYSSESESPGAESNQNDASEKMKSTPESKLLAQLKKNDDDDIEDKVVSNKELKEMMEKYFKGDEEVLPSIMEGILMRRLTNQHEDTDDELIEELAMKPLDNVKDKDFDSDFDEMYSTDEELDDLYNAKEHVMQKMADDEFFNMDDKKWDDMIKEAVEHGHLKDTKECEAILEDMLSWDKLLPADIKEKVEKKFNELGDMCERGELEPEEAYKLFKEYEDEIVEDYGNKMEANPPQFDETVPDEEKDLDDDPPGEGPILRWLTRVVFSPGGDAWHPKNRLVKMSVTVKELGLSIHQFKRLRELVGKRYHPGKDELTITSERFEHREENRKDCLRTLFSLIEETGKANKLAEDARATYVKGRLQNNPAFMERLRAKVTRQASQAKAIST